MHNIHERGKNDPITLKALIAKVPQSNKNVQFFPLGDNMSRFSNWIWYLFPFENILSKKVIRYISYLFTNTSLCVHICFFKSMKFHFLYLIWMVKFSTPIIPQKIHLCSHKVAVSLKNNKKDWNFLSIFTELSSYHEWLVRTIYVGISCLDITPRSCHRAL